MKNYNIYILDENLYYIYIKNNIDVKILEDLEKNGKLLVTPKATTKILKTIDKFNYDSSLLMTWKFKIQELSKEYFLFLNNYKAYEKLDSEISIREKEFVTLFKGFDSSLSSEDMEILVNAYILRKISNYEVYVISEDSDLLCSAHLLFSFLGFQIRIISIYELLKITKMDSYLKVYCDHYGILKEFSEFDDMYAYTKDAIKTLLEKGILSLHSHKKKLDNLL